MSGAYSHAVPGRTHILIVEDEVDVAHLIKHTLERGGDVEVGIALTAEAALSKAAEAPPDLIVLDLNLPGFDGLALCRILRSRPTSAAIPIIMVAARTSEGDRLLERVWGYDHAIDTRSVDVHIGRLRGKPGACAAQIETVIGLGYRFVEDEGAVPAARS